MNYASVCDGIGAAHCAWKPLCWHCAWTSEIEPFPIAVVDHHWQLPNLGDMTRITDAQLEQHGRIRLLVGGTPCQSFSVAGLRKGLADPRGNLALGFLGLVDRTRPEWVVWENVPGVLSSNKGRDFGTFLGALGELGYGFAYSVLDAQYFGLAQRRKRVFVVGCIGDWRRAAAVLFERASLQGHPAPRREKRQVAPTIPARRTAGGGLGTDFDCDGGLIHEVAPTLDAAFATKWGLDNQHIDSGVGMFVTHSLRAEGFDASEDGTGRGTPIVPATFAIRERAVSENIENGPQGKCYQPDHAYTLEARNKVQAVAFAQNQRDELRIMETAGSCAAESGTKQTTYIAHSGVRRLTPRECERLQGFPEITKSVRIVVCKNAAENADHANVAGGGSAPPRHATNAPVAVSVLIDLERQHLQLLKAGKLIWSASIAETPSESPLAMPVGDFARLGVLTLTMSDRTIRSGGAEPHQNSNASLVPENGSNVVTLSGSEIGAAAESVASVIAKANDCLRSTTLDRGPSSRDSEQITRTLCCCVIRAISSCIPETTWRESSFCFSLSSTQGYTNIQHRGKPAADGPRYRALGNSMAVPVMRWIGSRIQMMEERRAV